jgi:nitroimidazol reductase NimA-like FMN-containing flavoprotein (pyridoxamine 5'-phosphate oxidase superfamily)
MFREMRRNKQKLSKTIAITMLKTATAGVLAVHGDEGYPYAVPVSHVYDDGRLFFHSAVEGHKVDAIRQNAKVSFCVIQQDEVIPEALTTLYRSVIVFGTAKILTDAKEKQHALECLAHRFSEDYMEKARDEIRNDWDRLIVVEVKIEHITGKASLKLLS